MGRLKGAFNEKEFEAVQQGVTVHMSLSATAQPPSGASFPLEPSEQILAPLRASSENSIIVSVESTSSP
jgi:hypothetical protein